MQILNVFFSWWNLIPIKLDLHNKVWHLFIQVQKWLGTHPFRSNFDTSYIPVYMTTILGVWLRFGSGKTWQMRTLDSPRHKHASVWLHIQFAFGHIQQYLLGKYDCNKQLNHFPQSHSQYLFPHKISPVVDSLLTPITLNSQPCFSISSLTNTYSTRIPRLWSNTLPHSLFPM